MNRSISATQHTHTKHSTQKNTEQVKTVCARTQIMQNCILSRFVLRRMDSLFPKWFAVFLFQSRFLMPRNRIDAEHNAKSSMECLPRRKRPLSTAVEPHGRRMSLAIALHVCTIIARRSFVALRSVTSVRRCRHKLLTAGRQIK